MTVKLIRDNGRDQPELKVTAMLKKEYVVVEKLYEDPLTGTGTGPDGSFDWTLYTVALHEYAGFDEDTMEVTTEKFDEPITVSFFKGAKTFTEKFNEFPVNTVVKITQTPIEGKPYKSFEIEKVGEGNTVAPEPDKNEELTMPAFVKKLKSKNIIVEDVVKQTLSKYPDQSADNIKAVYESL